MMTPQNLELGAGLIGSAYSQQAADARKRRENKVKILLTHRKWPDEGWDEGTIELLLHELSTMDSNNFIGNVVVGEREARIVCGMVARMHYRLGHGIGRSGDIAEVQPKAAGSSLMARLTESMALDCIKACGVTRAKACIVLPLATGMTLVLTLLSLRESRPAAKYVIWPRVDQKSCFKAITTAGFCPIVIPNKLVGDEVQTDLEGVDEAIASRGAENIAAVLTTVSVFAPRAPDDLVGVGKLCKKYGIPHVANNAYGLQASKYTHLINESIRVGRLDVFIQSTDKNLLVPVGGAIAAGEASTLTELKALHPEVLHLGPSKDLIAAIGRTYPGRASSAPILDVFVTLLSLGASGYKKLLQARKDNFEYLKERLGDVAVAHGERILTTKSNMISIGMSLSTIAAKAAERGQDIVFLGSMLFSRNVSGTRVLVPTVRKTISGVEFEGYGTHIDSYPGVYLTAAAAVGMERAEVDLFVERLDKCITEFTKVPSGDKTAKTMAKGNATNAKEDASTVEDNADRSASPVAQAGPAGGSSTTANPNENV